MGSFSSSLTSLESVFPRLRQGMSLLSKPNLFTFAATNQTPSTPRSIDQIRYPNVEITEMIGSIHDGDQSHKEGSMSEKHYYQLIQAMAEADNPKRDASDESIRRAKAEKDVIESIGKFSKESRRVMEVEEELARIREEHENVRMQLDEVTGNLLVALEKKSYLEEEIANFDLVVLELEQRMSSAVELSEKHKKERDDALRTAEELRKKQAETSPSDRTSKLPQFFLAFSIKEMLEATNDFDASFKLRDVHNGSIYRATHYHTQVAVKILHSHNLQEASEFLREVNVLSQLRHPNLVTLIGACPEAWILIYEHLAHGSLEDRLDCKDNTPPLPWQTRIRIAAEICSVLIYIHSCRVVHGELNPANILLDDNFVSKLSDFSLCRVLSESEVSSNKTLCRHSDIDGTLAYMDPEFLETGELTPQSNVYSFGIILLRLLTGMPAKKIAKKVQIALVNGNLRNILDPAAGEWSFLQAKQVAHLALRCCEKESRNRPDLVPDVLRVLESMKTLCGASPLIRLNSEEDDHIPNHFMCPIFQEIMMDPVVAADGFTYEADALKGWFSSGHDTSPMTNLKLASKNLLPNHALRSAIQEWLLKPSNF